MLCLRVLFGGCSSFYNLVFVMTIIYAIGDNPFPWDLSEAVKAYLSALLLAVGVGVLAGVIVMFSPFFATIYALMMILVYLGSGTLFVISSLPDVISTPLSYNQLFMRWNGCAWRTTRLTARRSWIKSTLLDLA